MISVAADPMTCSGTDSVNGPITRWLLASIIIRVMIGAAATPLITALA